MSEIKLIEVEKVDEELLKEIVIRILGVIEPLKIILFGSWAYGKTNKNSDLDILVVVKEENISRLKIACEIYGALCGILIPKDIVVVSPQIIEEWKEVPQAFITTIIRKGRVIYVKKD